MKKIGFLSFGHWTASPQSQTRSASDALLQSIELAVAAEELGADGAYFRVHHFARQLASPFPLLAALRRENQADRDRHRGHRHALREPAVHGGGRGRSRPHRGGRLQLGISRGSPEQVIDGFRYFGYVAARGHDRRRHGAASRRGAARGAARRGLRQAQPAPDVSEPARPAARRAVLGGPARAHLVGRRHQRHRRMGGQARDEPAELDAQDRRERQALSCAAGRADPALIARRGRRPDTRARRGCQSAAASSRWWTTATAPISAEATRARTRSVLSVATTRAIFGRSYAAEPDLLIEQLKKDRGDRGSRHAAVDRAESARRRLQRPCHRGDPQACRAGARLALTGPGSSPLKRAGSGLWSVVARFSGASGSAKVPGLESWKTLVSVTA